MSFMQIVKIYLAYMYPERQYNKSHLIHSFMPFESLVTVCESRYSFTEKIGPNFFPVKGQYERLWTEAIKTRDALVWGCSVKKLLWKGHIEISASAPALTSASAFKYKQYKFSSESKVGAIYFCQTFHFQNSCNLQIGGLQHCQEKNDKDIFQKIFPKS